MIRAPTLYVMHKPPVETALEIDGLRGSYAIDRAYGQNRLHTTLLPLGEASAYSRTDLACLDRALRTLDADPFRMSFDTVRGNALVNSTPSSRLRALQREVVRRVIACGVTPPFYAFRPHMTLAYRAPLQPARAITPIGWWADEVLLVMSIVGEGRHELLGRYPLATRQHAFAFG